MLTGSTNDASASSFPGEHSKAIESLIGVITNLVAHSTEERKRVSAAGAIAVFTKLIKICVAHPSPQAKAHVSKAAAAALWLLVLEPDNHAPFLKNEGPTVLLALCDEQSTDEYLQAAFGIFRIVTAEEGSASSRTTLATLGVVDRAVALIKTNGSADVLEQVVALIGTLAEDDSTRAEMVGKGVLDVLHHLLKPIPPAKAPKQTSQRRGNGGGSVAKPKYRPDRIILGVASTVASVIVGDPNCQTHACNTGILAALVQHVHLASNMRVFAQLLVSIEVTIADNSAALTTFKEIGGTEALCDSLARASDEGSLVEALRVTDAIFADDAAKVATLKEAHRLHYDFVGMLKHIASISEVPSTAGLAKKLLLGLESAISPTRKVGTAGGARSGSGGGGGRGISSKAKALPGIRIPT